MKKIDPSVGEIIEGPRAARPAFVQWLSGGAQNFPTDTFLDRVRDARLRAAGLIKVRRIPAKAVA